MVLSSKRMHANYQVLKSLHYSRIAELNRLAADLKTAAEAFNEYAIINAPKAEFGTIADCELSLLEYVNIVVRPLKNVLAAKDSYKELFDSFQ